MANLSDQKNQSEVSATEGIIRLSVPIVFVVAILSFVIFGVRQTE